MSRFRLPRTLCGGRVRTSTALLGVAFVGALLLWYAVRPDPAEFTEEVVRVRTTRSVEREDEPGQRRDPGAAVAPQASTAPSPTAKPTPTPPPARAPRVPAAPSTPVPPPAIPEPQVTPQATGPDAQTPERPGLLPGLGGTPERAAPSPSGSAR